jgi:hypothetical protein
MPNSRPLEHRPSASRPPVLTRGEYAERGRQLYQPRAPTPFVMTLIMALFVVTILLNYGGIGPAAESARLGLIAVIIVGFFLLAHMVVRRRAGRLGILCPACGRYPLGVRGLRYTTKAQVEAILARGCCERCGKGLFHAAT